MGHLARNRIFQEVCIPSPWLAGSLPYIGRINCCLFTLTTLMTVAYDIQTSVVLPPGLKPPCHEELWEAGTEDEWLQLSTATIQQNSSSVSAIIRQLSDESLPLPVNVGTLGCHVVIVALLKRILSFRISCESFEPSVAQKRQDFITSLRRWQRMWENEPESSLSPHDPRGPILFNSTAILRLSYVRLVADFSSVRRSFSILDSPQEIEREISRTEPISRDLQTTRAALQTCLALRVPVYLGLKLVARTSFWNWSVQHALSYFECALYLAKWLRTVQTSKELSEDERAVLNLSREVLQASRNSNGEVAPHGLPAEVLRSWAHLLDTADVTVWSIIPKMARVLSLHADRLSQEASSYHMSF